MQNPVSEEAFQPSPAKKQKTKEQRKKEMISWLTSLLCAVIAALIIRTFLFSFVMVKGDSMLDTLQTGDRLYVSILSAKLQGYERGDIVVCRYPGRTDFCIKRVIGLPGDIIFVDKGAVFVNGEAITEDYLTRFGHYSYPETLLNEGEYFLLGDNRPISHDSHSADVGPVTDIVGKARVRIWPLNKIGLID